VSGARNRTATEVPWALAGMTARAAGLGGCADSSQARGFRPAAALP